jgi:hypothetical protein
MVTDHVKKFTQVTHFSIIGVKQLRHSKAMRSALFITNRKVEVLTVGTTYGKGADF